MSTEEVQALARLAEEDQRAGRLDEALGNWLRILELTPGSTQAMLRAGSLLAAQRDFDAAYPYFTRVLDAEPDNIEANYKLGKILQFQNQLEEAGVVLSHVVALQPGHVAAVLDLGDIASALGDSESAMAFFHQALALEPDNRRAVAALAWLLDLAGEYEAGLRLLEPMMVSAETRPAFTVSWARLNRRVGDPQASVTALAELLHDPDTDPNQRMRAHFLMGDLMDEQGDYDNAVVHYREGNRLKPLTFDPAEARAHVDGLIDFFSARRLSGLPRATESGELPVFVVGMPRSGTSLVEQIIASHPAVLGGGERLGIYLIEQDLPLLLGAEYPICLEGVNAAQLNELAAHYLAGFGELDPAICRVTDKYTTNFLSLGLIEMLFPGARVIHCTRNPLDTAVSCYFQDFLGDVLPWTYDLDHIADYYVHYHRLMDHWRGALSLPMMDLSYESLTRDTERVSRELIEFLGLEWDPVCLEFHRQRRVVNTASYAQVREPVYTRSVNRHQHYAELLQPVARILQEAGISF